MRNRQKKADDPNSLDSGTRAKRHRINLNVGTVVFFIIFVYLCINIVIYLFQDKISVVKVEDGEITDNSYYTGIVLREEETVVAESSGSISYYVANATKVAKGGNVYMLQTAESESESGTDLSSLTTEDYTEISDIISSYMDDYSDSEYADLYTFKYDLQNQVSEALSSQSITAAVDESAEYESVVAKESGIVSYTYDGMESLTADDITDDLFSEDNYEREQIVSNQWIESGEVAYKLVTDDDWSIVIMLTDEQSAELSEETSVTICFLEDDIEATADVEVFSNGESDYAQLSLSKYMVRYITDRYLDIEIESESADGLKIPVSSVVTKAFYKIPIEYLVTDEDTEEEGFYKYTYDEDGELQAIFYNSSIYAEDEEYCYVDTDDFEDGDAIGLLNSSDTYTIHETEDLTGVYNVNQGYAIFRLIDILYQNDEYCIIDDDTSYGVTLYDYIALNGSEVEEGQMIY